MSRFDPSFPSCPGLTPLFPPHRHGHHHVRATSHITFKFVPGLRYMQKTPIPIPNSHITHMSYLGPTLFYDISPSA
jgi:hypothetical protein